jgi:guanine nucleotide-binding protein G(i) subunit alpha
MLQSMHRILNQCGIMRIKMLSENDDYHALISRTTEIEINVSFPLEVINGLRKMWADPGVQECFRSANLFQLSSSTEYFYNNFDRIFVKDYVPNEQDILQVRIKTTGIVESIFHVNNLTYKVFDFGGQRSERKKWLQYFDTVDALVFVAACSEYDQYLCEDDTVNRLDESITLFSTMCNSKFFANTAKILLLNKVDIFEKKLKTSPIERLFPGYKGGDDLDSAKDFIRDKFLAVHKDASNKIYLHFTCGTDRNNMQFIINSISDTLLKRNIALSKF